MADDGVAEFSVSYTILLSTNTICHVHAFAMLKRLFCTFAHTKLIKYGKQVVICANLLNGIK